MKSFQSIAGEIVEKAEDGPHGQRLIMDALRNAVEEREALIADLVGAIEQVVGQFNRMKERQNQLLVQGQTVESASKNWEEFPEDFSADSIDFNPLIEALSKARERLQEKPAS